MAFPNPFKDKMPRNLSRFFLFYIHFLFLLLPSFMALGSKLPRESSFHRDESLQLLKQVSKVLMKKRGTAVTEGKILQKLYEQLVSLRSVVPYFNPNRDVECVISDALEYRNLLKEQLQTLTPIDLDASLLGPSQEVEVSAEDNRILICVCCEKRHNLLPALMEEIETLGFDYEEINISCEKKLVIRALGLQKQEQWLQPSEVKRRLVSLIEKD